MDAPEETGERAGVLAGVEEIADALPERGDGVTGRDLRPEERPHAEVGPRHAATRPADHRLGDVDPDDVVAAPDQVLGPDAAAATEVDDPARGDAGAREDLENAGPRVTGAGRPPGGVDHVH